MIDAAIAIALCGLSAAALVRAAVAVFGRRRLWRESGLGRDASPRLAALHSIQTIVAALHPLAEKCCTSRWKARTSRTLAAAGFDGKIDASQVAAAELLAVAAGAIAALLLFPGAGLLRACAGACIAPAVVEWELRSRAGRRRRELEYALPGALDWLALSVEAGEGFGQALCRVVRQLPAGALREELSRVHAEMQTGLSRRAAFRGFAQRAQVPSVSSFVALLLQADALGMSIGPTLKATAARLRRERFARAEKRGMLAAQKMLLPLMLCIMPATFLVIFGPLVVRVVLHGIRGLFG